MAEVQFMNPASFDLFMPGHGYGKEYAHQWNNEEPPTSQAETYLLNYWALNGEQTTCCTDAAAVTDHYSAYDLNSSDSAASGLDALACTEQLLGTSEALGESFSARQSLHSSNPETPRPSVCDLGQPAVSATAQVRETLRYEMRREAETRPEAPYFRSQGVTQKLRSTAVTWAVQVADQFRSEQETLFLAISYLDRFLSTTKEVVHLDGLQLATLACLSLASKQSEVTQPTTAEWTWLVQGNSWGTKEQLARMEWIVMDCLDWRGCTPTSWWFLHLFCYGLGTCPAPCICLAAYLLELGLLDGNCLAYDYSALAAAALILGHASFESNFTVPDGSGVGPLHIQQILSLAPDLNLRHVHDACRALAQLQHAACVQAAPNAEQQQRQSEQQSEEENTGLLVVRNKYSTDVWHNVGAMDGPLNLQAALVRL